MIDSLLQPLVLPDLWQQQAVGALRNGQDVVVHAPTGAGKTFVFELYQPSIRGQSIFTVPTRALANDKFAEWRAKGWDVGIATGDLALRLDAKVIVATLETQKARFLQRKGPKLLVVDEYQMLGDPVRGVNYELALALAPAETQLLLLSGSVANPQGVVDWLRRIGRDAVLIAHDQRPVPLQEVNLLSLPDRAAQSVRDRLPRWVANALRAGLGPILIFAPRRRAAEELAKTLAQALPPDQPLGLTDEQATLAGSRLARFLRSRVAFHHSGLSYAQRAGLIEPLAKHGQLRVVVATMGLAAGINFSMRSVLVSGTTYKAGNMEREVQPDELLQMYGRAGRRGLDDAGFALVTPHPPRLLDARPRQLRRAAPLDWPTLIEVMRSGSERSEIPFVAALELNRRLFTPAEIPLGTEHSLATGPMPCRLWVDMERARFARRGVLEILNSRDEWEPRSENREPRALSEVMIRKGEAWRPALSNAATLEGIGVGNICKVTNDLLPTYGRELSIGTRQGDGTLTLSPLLKRTFNLKRVNLDALETKVLSRLPGVSGGARIVALFPRDEQLVARVDFGSVQVSAWVDRYGVALRDPPERQVLPAPCRGCPELPWCSSVEIVFSPAYAWRGLRLIDPGGNPTPRGILFSFFHRGEGLAVAAALEDPEYPIDDLLFDLANLRAGPRFSGDDSPFGGRLGGLCQQTFERTDYPGYLEMGVPPEYGAGASEIVREIVEHSSPWSKFVTESLRHGDIERALIEWRSLLRHIVWAPDYELLRWRELKSAAARFMESTESPLLAELPLLTAAQRQRNNR